eukprot:m.311666 g.311666  ORF g.311666 m.311666 type:complete len:173 (+) comp98077_c0_seq1:31-549(+)
MEPNSVAYYKSPIGIYQLEASETGLKSVKLLKEDRSVDPALLAASNVQTAGNVAIKAALSWLQSYFENPDGFKDKQQPPLPPLDLPQHYLFMNKVWKTLVEKVAFGHTVSYGELGDLAGRARASRAVGQAMKRNPVSLMIPCHRVLPKQGGVGMYSSPGGSETKQWLLDHER